VDYIHVNRDVFRKTTPKFRKTLSGGIGNHNDSRIIRLTIKFMRGQTFLLPDAQELQVSVFMHDRIGSLVVEYP
jgi:hypothetical protein